MPKDYVILETFAPLHVPRSFDGAPCAICGGAIFADRWACRVQDLYNPQPLTFAHRDCMKPATIVSADDAL
jgi:hypothetical protein